VQNRRSTELVSQSHHARCVAMMQALAQKNLGDISYQKRHEAITPPTRPSSNATKNTTVIKNSSQSSGNREGTPLRSISLTRFCSSSKSTFSSALRPDSKSIIFRVGFSKTLPKLRSSQSCSFILTCFFDDHNPFKCDFCDFLMILVRRDLCQG
jgi:hypothetical protein